MACARPTRRLKPLDSVSMVCCEHRLELQPADDVVEPLLAMLALERAQVGDEIEESAHAHLAVGRRALG